MQADVFDLNLPISCLNHDGPWPVKIRVRRLGRSLGPKIRARRLDAVPDHQDVPVAVGRSEDEVGACCMGRIRNHDYGKRIVKAHVRSTYAGIRRGRHSVRPRVHRRMCPLVRALRTLRGVEQLVGPPLVAELGEPKRLAHRREPMGYLGLVPTEHASGDRHRLGANTKTGNSQARRMLIEAAWNCRFAPRISVPLHKRQEMQPSTVRAVASMQGACRLRRWRCSR